MKQDLPLIFSPEVKKAIQDKSPILGLESTIITHGMPFPANLETAKLTEGIALKEGGTPATIAVIPDNIKVHKTRLGPHRYREKLFGQSPNRSKFGALFSINAIAPSSESSRETNSFWIISASSSASR